MESKVENPSTDQEDKESKVSMTDDPLPAFPNYPKPNPQGIPLPSHPKQQAPLMKLLGRMLKPPTVRRGKVLHSRQSVHITQRKKKWY